MEKHRSLRRSGAIVVLVFALWVSAYAAETSRKHVFIRATDCNGQLSSAVLASLRKELRGSEAFQPATSLKDSGGFKVVVAVYTICTEATLHNSDRIVSLATIFGFATCDDGTCHVATDEESLGVFLCSENHDVGCGRDMYGALADYMSKEGGIVFNTLSKERTITGRHR